MGCSHTVGRSRPRCCREDPALREPRGQRACSERRRSDQDERRAARRRCAQPHGREHGEGEIQMDPARVAGRSVPGDVHRLDRRSSRRRSAHGRDPRRPREQAPARVGESAGRLSAAHGAQRQVDGDVPLGLRSAAHGRALRPVAGRAGCVQDLLSDAGALPERDPAAGQRHVRQRLDAGSGSGCRSCRTGRPAGCSVASSTSSRRFALG